MYGLIKIVWGICFASVPFGVGFSMFTVLLGLCGLLMTLSGIADAMRSLGDLLETPSSPPHQQTRP
jgi:hypothetical protein